MGNDAAGVEGQMQIPCASRCGLPEAIIASGKAPELPATK